MIVQGYDNHTSRYPYIFDVVHDYLKSDEAQDVYL